MVQIKIKAPKFSRRKIAALADGFATRAQTLSHDAARYAKQPQGRRGITPRTGKLFASISAIFRRNGPVIVAGLRSTHPAAVALEYGGTIPATTLTPKRGRAVRFQSGGDVRFSSGHALPARTLPPHPFLRPSLRKAARDFRRDIRAAIKAFAEHPTE